MHRNRKLFKTLALAGLIVGITKCLHFRAWKMANGLEGEDRARRWRRDRGPKPPWVRHWDKLSEEKTEEAEADHTVGAAEAAA